MSTWHLLIALLGWYTGWSAAAWIAFWLDKRRATRGGWRVRERTLLALAAVGGFPGAYAARSRLRHKSRDRAFSWRLHALAVLHVCVAVGLAWLVLGR